jgi:hypothetical protein
VRPFIDPAKSPARVRFISSGSAQLLVGPASSLRLEQMNVRSSTRATSAGSERTKMLFGLADSAIGMAVPACTISRFITWYSSDDPSHQWIRSGRHMAATSFTHPTSFSCLIIETP